MAINPYAPATATGNGVQVDFTFTFPYIFQAHVKATLNGVATTAFTFFSSNVLRFTVAPGNGVVVVISRETPGDALAAVIQPGGPLPIVGLNNNFLQGLYYAQETEFASANQSTAGLQAQITTATNTANNASALAGAAVTTANNAEATANGLASSIATANATAASAVATAGDAEIEAAAATAAVATALLKTGGTMTGPIVFASAQPGVVTRATAINTTSGTSHTFSSLPSGLRKIELLFNKVSTNGTALPRVRLGTGGVLATSGYESQSSTMTTAVVTTGSTAGFDVFSNTAPYEITGKLSFDNLSGNLWICSGVLGFGSSLSATSTIGGLVTLGGVLDTLRLTTSNGTDTFDGGSINLLYQ